MVDVELDTANQVVTLTTPKKNVTYTLKKDPFGFGFVFGISKGQLDKELSGRFSSLVKGIEFFKTWENKEKSSHAARSDHLEKLRRERRAKPDTESS